MIGSVGSLANGGSRVIMGPLQDKIGFKPMYGAILSVMLIVYSTIPYVVKFNAALYSIWVVAAFYCLGTHFTMFPLVNVKVFGQKSGGQMASFMYIATGLSGLTSLSVSSYLKNNYEAQSFQIMCSICSVSVVVAFFIRTFLFKEEEIRH